MIKIVVANGRGMHYVNEGPQKCIRTSVCVCLCVYTYHLSSQLDEKLFALEGDFHDFQPCKKENIFF